MSHLAYKVVLLGEGRVGKTSLCLQYVNKVFSDKQKSTITATYLDKFLNIGKKSVKLMIWDTAFLFFATIRSDTFDYHDEYGVSFIENLWNKGFEDFSCLQPHDGQERFHALGPIYYRDANGAVLVYDITDRDSFKKVRHWVKELRKIVGKDIVLCIIGNKIDLEKKRQVDKDEAIQYAEQVGAVHMLASAKTGANVEQSFLELTKGLIKKTNETMGSNRRGGGNRRGGVGVALTNKTEKSTSCCN